MIYISGKLQNNLSYGNKFGKQRLCRLIQGINDLSFDTLNVNELQEQLKAEADVDLTFFEDSVTTGLEV